MIDMMIQRVIETDDEEHWKALENVAVEWYASRAMRHVPNFMGFEIIEREDWPKDAIGIVGYVRDPVTNELVISPRHSMLITNIGAPKVEPDEDAPVVQLD